MDTRQDNDNIKLVAFVIFIVLAFDFWSAFMISSENQIPPLYLD